MDIKNRISYSETDDGKKSFLRYWIRIGGEDGISKDEYVEDIYVAIKKAKELGRTQDAMLLEQLRDQDL
jgi:hypothetical protein